MFTIVMQNDALQYEVCVKKFKLRHKAQHYVIKNNLRNVYRQVHIVTVEEALQLVTN